MKTSRPETISGIALPIATLIAILATLVVNALSNFFPPQGLNIGAIANTLLQGVRITPANYAFAIWGLIYLGLIAYGLYQLQPAQRCNPTIRRVDWLLIMACLAQIAWVYLFTLRQFWLSVVAMLAILLPLIGAYRQLGIGTVPVSRDRQWRAQVPFSIYLGWISVATVVNIASALYSAGWDGSGLSAEAWTALMLIVSGMIAAIVVLQRADVAFTSVFVWAYIAIAVRQWNTPLIWVTAATAAATLVALLVWSTRRRESRKVPG